MLTAYLKRYRPIWILGCIFVLVFALVFYLHNLPVEAVVYATVLCLSVGLIYFSVDFWHFLKRHRMLLDLDNQLSFIPSDLPKPLDILEEDYQAIINKMFQQNLKQVTDAETIHQEMLEYYNLWVHQIKTPISAMRLLLQEDEDQNNAELSLELFKIENYVEMVLHYLKIESPASDFVFKYHDLNLLVRQAVRKYARMFIQKKLKLELAEFECKILTDEKWLVFVIEQILSNALKYTHEGTISIYLDSSKPKALVIEDTGIGIAATDLPRVFDQGYTGYNGRLDQRSTGIGLYLCHKILTKLSHTIEIESLEGEGTKVIIGLDTVDYLIE